MSNFEKWQSGIELNFAFFEFASDLRKNEFRDSANQEFTKLDMYFDLYNLLRNSELEAWGLKSDSDINNNPEKIPHFVFSERPILSNCNEYIIEYARWKFLKVTISKSDSADNSNTCTGIIDNDLSVVKAKIGRPSTYNVAKSVFLILLDRDKSQIKKSANRLLIEFNEIYMVEAPHFGLAPIALAERTLRGHLERFRQELAETGNNDFAS